ncbi:MAG: hypothetical protein Q4A30_02560, partial [Candidatus Saccharibacteria bacterium]|nr:hypothetical protein [Candidatus Saccharibacteria bacterium]
LLGITDIQHIELKYDIIINGGSENQIVHEGYYDIFPKGEENRVKHVRDLETDIVLVDNDYVRILLTELDEFRNFNTGNDKILSLNFHYFIENKTDQLLETNFYNIYLNGLEEKITDFHYAYTQPHRATYRSVYLGEDDLEALGIKEFKDVKFKLQVLDKNGDRIMAEEFQFERKDFKKEFKYE